MKKEIHELYQAIGERLRKLEYMLDSPLKTEAGIITGFCFFNGAFYLILEGRDYHVSLEALTAEDLYQFYSQVINPVQFKIRQDV